MRWLGLLMVGFLAGCRQPNEKETKQSNSASPTGVSFMQSDPAAGHRYPINTNQPKLTNWLAWEWDTNKSQYFEVWRANDVRGPWARWTNVLTDHVEMARDGAAGFYKVRSVDFATGLIGPWATTQ